MRCGFACPPPIMPLLVWKGADLELPSLGKGPWKAVIGSSLCLASVPALAFAPNHMIDKRAQRAASFRLQPASKPVLSIHPRTPKLEVRAARVTSNSRISDASMRQMPRVQTLRQGYLKQKPRLRYVTIHSGDSLWALSQRYHVSLTHLERWNHLTVNSVLPIDERLTINGPNPAPPRVHNMPVQTPATNSGGSSRLSSRSSNGPTGVVAAGVRGLSVVDYAKEFIGTPYVWGGVGPNGFDCSGYVEFVYAHFGIHLGRTSYEQFDEGTPVYMADLLPGDLVFFSTYGPGASHVGIYIGSGQFISASGSAVQILAMNTPYWSSHYIGARRV